MPAHVLDFNGLFFFLFPHFREDLDQEEKARFGELCSGENGKGREWFARYVSAQVRGEMGEEAAILCQGFGAAWAGGSGQGNSAMAQSNSFGGQKLGEREELQSSETQK